MKSSCSNCGNSGHINYQCKLPITSYGLIVYRNTPDQGPQYLMIRRKDSFGYIDFMRGHYQLNNIIHLKQLIDEMSVQEKERILSEPFPKLWQQLWGEGSGIRHRGEEQSLNKKFDIVRSGIIKDADVITLRELVETSSTAWPETEWEFPKGRKNHGEKDLDCAIREFEEETGCDRKYISVVENVIPYEEMFIGSNHKAYKHKYFLACYDGAACMREDVFQKTEVSAVRWKTLDECLETIRPYSVEKKRIVAAIDRLLKEYVCI